MKMTRESTTVHRVQRRCFHTLMVRRHIPVRVTVFVAEVSLYDGGIVSATHVAKDWIINESTQGQYYERAESILFDALDELGL